MMVENVRNTINDYVHITNVKIFQYLRILKLPTNITFSIPITVLCTIICMPFQWTIAQLFTVTVYKCKKRRL